MEARAWLTPLLTVTTAWSEEGSRSMTGMAAARLEASTACGVVTFDVDVEDIAGVGPERIGRERGIAIASLNGSVGEALAQAGPAAEPVVRTFRSLAPDEVTVESGLRIDAEAGGGIRQGGGRRSPHGGLKMEAYPSRGMNQ